MANKITMKIQIYLTVDFIMKLLQVVKKDTILVLYNILLKITYFVPIIEEISAKRLTRLFRDNI